MGSAFTASGRSRVLEGWLVARLCGGLVGRAGWLVARLGGGLVAHERDSVPEDVQVLREARVHSRYGDAKAVDHPVRPSRCRRGQLLRRERLDIPSKTSVGPVDDVG